MKTRTITHVDFGNDYGKVHRLIAPVDKLTDARGRKVACGHVFHANPYCAGWTDYDETRFWMCAKCRKS